MSVIAEGDAVRRTLAAAMIAASGTTRPALIVQLVANAFATRLANAQSGQGVLQLAHWVQQTCERYGGLPDVAALLSTACPVAKDVIGNGTLERASLQSDLDTLAGAIAIALTTVSSRTFAAEYASDGVDEAIAAFLLKLDAADPLSAEHSRAVALWCSRLARRLGLSDERRTFVMRGGMLHDIGKVTTPAEILLAPRALTDEEFLRMRDHASAGAAMLTEIEPLRAFAPLVRSHHERLDGKGYPDALTAEQIPLEVRIVAVADCFNAMIGRRPYRAPLSPATALEQLIKHRETQFDAAVVEAMVDTVEHPDEGPGA